MGTLLDPIFFSSSKHFLIRGRLLIRVESRPFLFALLGFWRSETPEEAASLSVVEVVVAKRQNLNWKMSAALTTFALDDPLRVLYEKHERSAQPESRRVITALEATCSVISEKNLRPSPVSVYAATMASLTQSVVNVESTGGGGGGGGEWFDDDDPDDDDGRAGRGEADATRDADDIVGRVGTLVSNGD